MTKIEQIKEGALNRFEKLTIFETYKIPDIVKIDLGMFLRTHQSELEKAVREDERERFATEIIKKLDRMTEEDLKYDLIPALTDLHCRKTDVNSVFYLVFRLMNRHEDKVFKSLTPKE
jgi:hypothetical protein